MFARKHSLAKFGEKKKADSTVPSYVSMPSFTCLMYGGNIPLALRFIRLASGSTDQVQ